MDSQTGTRRRKTTPQQQSVRKKRVHKRKKQKMWIPCLILLLVIMAVAGYAYVTYHKYSGYEVKSSTKRENASASQYLMMGKNVFRYSGNGASLTDEKEDTLWDKTFEIQNVKADVCEEKAVVYGLKENSLYIFNTSGMLGNISTELPILKARVSAQGTVAAILEDGETTWINFYGTNGTLIASGKTRIDDPGYPVDLTVSPDGKIVMVSYVFVEGDTTTSYIAYYNLGSDGQKEMDNIVSSYKYPGVMIPEVVYINDSTSVAFGSDGFAVYTGNEKPEETAKISEKEEIISSFYGENCIGLVFKGTNAEKDFLMKVYDLDGNLKFQKEFNIQYTSIRVSDDQIIMNNENQVCIYSMKGIEKFNGTIDEGIIGNIFKIGYNKYKLILETGVNVIKLK